MARREVNFEIGNHPYRMIITDVEPVSVPFKKGGRIRMPIGMEEIENWFTYHTPDETQQVGYVAIRNAAKELAKVIVNNTPPSADQTAAIRKLREAVATANMAIACKGQ